MGSAETGSGKTAAFLLPVLQRLLRAPRGESTRVLVLVPTRELALQVHTVAAELAEGTPVECFPVYGGVPVEGQSHALRRAVDIVVATPGRLLDHAGRGSTRFRGLEVLVLDEADRMLDMGFIPDIRRIASLLPVERQTLLFSATMAPEVVALARDLLRDPVRVQVGPVRTTAVPVGITHAIFPVPESQKTRLLEVLLRREGMHSVLVFTRTKQRADRLQRDLRRAGFMTGLLHGDRSQQERERELTAFMDGYVKVLVATDVAARGIDIEGITHVVNYDFPRSPEDYLHRVGRTARAAARGDAFALVSPEEERDVPAVERVMGASIPRVTLPEFDYAGGAGGPSTDRPRGAHRGDAGRRRDGGGRGARGGEARGDRGGGGGRGRPGGGGGSDRHGHGARRDRGPRGPRERGVAAPAASAPEPFGPPPAGAPAPPPPPAAEGAARGPRRRRRGGRGRRPGGVRPDAAPPSAPAAPTAPTPPA